jgi:ABC-type multidrug transport system fused ATPase/permease subunit
LKNVVKNILSILITTEKKWFWHITLADLLLNILDIAFLASLIGIINAYTRKNHVTHFGFLTILFNGNFYLLLLAFFILFAFKNFFGLIVLKKQHHFVYQVALRIAQNSLSSYLSSDYNNFAQVDSSVHFRKISQQSIQFGQYLLLNLLQIISQSVLIFIAVIAILLFNASLFILLLLVIIPPVVFTFWLIKKRLQLLRYHAKTNSEKSIQHLNEALNGYVESNIYDKKTFFTKRFEKYQRLLNYQVAALQSVQGYPSRIIEIFALLGLCLIIIINKLYLNGNTPILLIGAFMGAAYKIIPGVVKILNSAGQIKAYDFILKDMQQSNADLSRIGVNYDYKIRSIQFENITFYFGDRKILDNISFTVNVGDFVGISGVSGKGKTTIINLLLGFLKADKGSVSINGSNAYEENCGKFCIKHISYVKQQPFLIHGTLLENILFDENNYDQKKLSEIISVTEVDKIIFAHKEGLEYIIEENGKNISGGERQKIIFARALYKTSDLLILDEAFTEMDEASETKMIRHLKDLASEGKMILLITHNKNSFGYCNKIISFND